MQYVFPPAPSGTGRLTFRYQIDRRYRPQLFGGNPCPNASQTYNCSLCTDGPWDRRVAPGLYVMWSAAGRDGHEITGPHNPTASYDAGEMWQTVDAPASLGLAEGEYPVVTLLAFNQYPTSNGADSGCPLTSGSDPEFPYKDMAGNVMVEAAELLYRPTFVLPAEPPERHPRVFGVDAQWHANHVAPFYAAPCDVAGLVSSPGWGEQKGALDLKSRFELITLGYSSCDEGPVDEGTGDIERHPAAAMYVGSGREQGVPPSDTEDEARRALHLIRRLWSCHNRTGAATTTGQPPCEYNQSETDRLAAGFIAVEWRRLDARHEQTKAFNGWQQSGAFAESFDLGTPAPVGYWSQVVDVFWNRPELLSPSNISLIRELLGVKVDAFRSSFSNKQWNLWNGNNWTPHLAAGVLYWAVVFWHVDARAREVVGMINDILWLFVPMFTASGVYKEGVSQYSYMAVRDAAQIATVHAAAFGALPSAFDALMPKLVRAFEWHLASMTGAGILVAFGDSHAQRGHTAELALTAALAELSAQRSEQGTAALLARHRQPISGCQLREYAAALYYFQLSSDPFLIEPLLLLFNDTACMHAGGPAQPLGGGRTMMFADGGYAELRTPLQPPSETPETAPPCFADLDGDQPMCVDATLPSLADLIPYAHLNLQGRPNAFPHSEVDFGTFVWTAWGVQLLSEHGYGTIATAVGDFDTRRYEFVDNNPAGHNTVVIREAFADGSDEINFSQLNKVDGVTSSASTLVSDGADCVELDGSAVYGALRANGWLDVMRRYACRLDGAHGTFVLVDVLAVKPNRTQMNVWGGPYAGPSFSESGGPHARLHVDEYFHTSTAAELSVSADGDASELLPVNALSSRFCAGHVDLSLSADAAAVELAPRCGIGSWRHADGLGVVSGHAAAGGHFVVDGLVTAPDRWKVPHAYKKRRFRWVGDATVGPEGDVRVFALTPSAATNRSATPRIGLGSCAAELGCAALAAPIECACTQLCMGGSLYWAVVAEARLKVLLPMGTCTLDATSVLVSAYTVQSLDAAEVARVRTLLGLTPPPPPPVVPPTSPPEGTCGFVPSPKCVVPSELSVRCTCRFVWLDGCDKGPISSEVRCSSADTSERRRLGRASLRRRVSEDVGLSIENVRMSTVTTETELPAEAHTGDVSASGIAL